MNPKLKSFRPDEDLIEPEDAVQRKPLANTEKEKYNDRLLDRVVELIRRGRSDVTACKHVEIPVNVFRHRVETDPKYAKKIERAKTDAIEKAEEAAYVRAVEGFKVPIIDKKTGAVVGYSRRYSDELLKFVLAAKKPEVYGQKIQQEVNINLRQIIDEARGRLIEHEPVPLPAPSPDDVFS